MTSTAEGVRLVDGLAVMATDGHVVVEGGPRRLRLSDPTSTRLLRDRSLLDGRRGIDELAAASGLDAAGVAAAVEALRTRGVLRRGAPGPEPDEFATYLGRMYPGDPGREALARLSRAHVRLAGRGLATDLIATTLQRSGLARVSRLEPGSAPDTAGPADLAVAVNSPVPTDEPCLPVRIVDELGEVGPLLGVRGARCPACCAPAEDRPAEEASPPVALVVAGLAAGAVLSFLGGYGPAPYRIHRLRVRPIEGTVDAVAVGCRADCPACGSLRLPVPVGAAARALDYEQSVETPLDGDASPMSRRTQVLTKVYFDLPTVSFGRSRADPGADGTEDGLVLALFRQLAVPGRRRPYEDGVRSPEQAVPSVADAGSVSTFVLPSHRPDVYSAGAYVDPDARELVLLRPGALRHRQPVRAVTVALVGNLQASTMEFGPAGRRIAFQDAGYVLGQLIDAAAGLGMPGSLVADWTASDIAGELDLSPSDAPLAVLGLQFDERRPAAQRRRGTGAMHYVFEAAEVDDGTVERVLSGAWTVLAQTDTAGLAHGLGVTVVARRGGRTNVRPVSAGAFGPPAPAADDRTGRIEAMLARRGLSVPAIILVTAELRTALAERGADGYQAAVVHAAALTRLLGLSAEREGLAAGLFGRLPSTVLFDRPSALEGGPRLLAAVGIGHPAADISAGSAVVW